MGSEDYVDSFELLTSLDPENLHALFHRLYFGIVYQIVFSACVALIGWEHLIHMPAEIRTWKLLLQGHILPARLAILLVRYATIASCIFASLFLWSGTEACVPLFYAHYACYCLLWASSTSIFLMRLNIIFLGQRGIMIGYIILWLCCFSTWIFVATRIRTSVIPPVLRIPYFTICFTESYPPLGVIAWSASVVFDTCVFIGTYLRFRTTVNTAKTVTQFRTRKWSFEANLFYFGTSCIFNIACLICILKVQDATLSHLGSLVAMTHHCIIATRLVFSAKGWAKHIGRDDDLILNTFNKRARARMLGITYTVDETVVVDCKADHPRNTVVGRTGLESSNNDGVPNPVQSADPFSPITRSPSSTGSVTAAQIRKGRRRSSQAHHGGDPLLPLPCMNDMRFESREKLVEPDSRGSSRSGSHLSTAIKYHYRSKRARSPIKQPTRESSFYSEDPITISQPPSMQFTHPFRARLDQDEASLNDQSRYKHVDDEVSPSHRCKDETDNLMSPTRTVRADSTVSAAADKDKEPAPRYSRDP